MKSAPDESPIFAYGKGKIADRGYVGTDPFVAYAGMEGHRKSKKV